MAEQKEKIDKLSLKEPPEFKYGMLNQMKQQMMTVQMIYEKIAFNIQKKISQGIKRNSLHIHVKKNCFII